MLLLHPKVPLSKVHRTVVPSQHVHELWGVTEKPCFNSVHLISVNITHAHFQKSAYTLEWPGTWRTELRKLENLKLADSSPLSLPPFLHSVPGMMNSNLSNLNGHLCSCSVPMMMKWTKVAVTAYHKLFSLPKVIGHAHSKMVRSYPNLLLIYLLRKKSML